MLLHIMKLYTNKTSIFVTFTLITEDLVFINQSEIEGFRKDDFKNVFEPIEIKIISFISWIIFETFTNIFLIFLIVFEKYGGDPMKRSINNQLVTHIKITRSNTQYVVWKIIRT